VVYISVDVKHKFTFKFTELLKHCSQRIYLWWLLRSQGLSIAEMNMVFVGFIVSRLFCVLPAWGVFVSAGQASRIDAFLKHAHKLGFCKDILLLMRF